MPDQESVNETWNIRADNYNKYVLEELGTERPGAWLRLIGRNAPGTRPLRVLDAGCGPGFFSVILSEAGHEVTGIDGSARMLAHARENAAARGLRPALLPGDFGSLDFPDGCFDLVISRNVTHTIREHLVGRGTGGEHRLLRLGRGGKLRKAGTPGKGFGGRPAVLVLGEKMSTVSPGEARPLRAGPP